MGLSVAIAGGIVMVTIMLVILSVPNVVNTIFSIGEVATKSSKIDDLFSKTEINTENITKNVGLPRVNFTLNNQGSTTLWDYQNFNVLVQYTGATSGKRTEQLSYNGVCLGVDPPAGKWCINSISPDVVDTKLLNYNEKAVIRSTVTQNLASSKVIVTVSTDNGVTFTNDGTPTRSKYLTIPTITYPKRWGIFIPSGANPTLSTTGNYLGLLSGATLDGTETAVYNTTNAQNSLVIESLTGGANSNAGPTFATAAVGQDIYRLDQASYLYFKWSVNQRVTGERLFIGFRSGIPTLPDGAANADAIITGRSAFGICIRTIDVTYQRCENDGAGAGTYTSLGVTETTAVHYAEIYAEADANQWCVSLDGNIPSCATSDIPVSNTRLFVNAQVETSDAVSETLSYYNMYVENNR